MSTSIHHEAEIWAAAAATGGLTETELKAWSDHLAACPACKKLNDEDLAMGHLIQRTLDPESPSPGFEQRILRRLDQARAQRENRWSAFLLFRPVLASGAAVLALLSLAAAGVLFHGKKAASVASAGPANVASLPGPVQSVIQHQADGKTVSNIERNEGDGQVSYTVSTKAPDATESGFTVAADGTLLSAETTLATLRQEVRDAIHAQIGRGKLKGIKANHEDSRTTYVATIVSRHGRQRDFTFNEDGILTSMEITVDDLPDNIKAAIDARLGGGRLAGIDKTFDDGETTYVATIVSQDGRQRDFTFGEDGALASMEVTPGELPAPVKATIDAHVGEGRLGGIDKTFDNGGTGYAATIVSQDGKQRDLTVSEQGKLLSREVAISETPESVRLTVSKVLGTGTIITIDQHFSESNKPAPFKIKGSKNGKPFNFLVSPTGDFLGNGKLSPGGTAITLDSITDQFLPTAKPKQPKQKKQ